jgi:hypothetical protein
MWCACPICKKERWVRLIATNVPRSKFCIRCFAKTTPEARRGAASLWWKGGRRKNSDGYVLTAVYPEDPYYSMASCKGAILEHRLVVAKSLSRCLEPWEIVHHKNGIRDDNRLENLELLSIDEHAQVTQMMEEIKRLRLRINQLEEQVTADTVA